MTCAMTRNIVLTAVILAAPWLSTGCAPAPSYRPQLDALVQRYGLDDAQRQAARQAYADWSREHKDLQASARAGGGATDDALLRQALLAQRLDGELRRVLNEEQYQEFRRSPGAADPTGLIPVLAQAGDPWAAVQALGGMRQSEKLVWEGNWMATANKSQSRFSCWNGESTGNLAQVISEQAIQINGQGPINDHGLSNPIYSISICR